MPKGKARLGGYIVPRNIDLSDEIDIELLLRYKKESHTKPEEQKLGEFHLILCNAFEKYFAGVENNNVVTNTERRAKLEEIRVLAKQVANSIKYNTSRENCGKLIKLNKLRYSLDTGTRASLHNALGHDTYEAFKKVDYGRVIDYPDESYETLISLAVINPKELIAKDTSSWVDPILVYLVNDIQQIWTPATGRKALGRTSFDASTQDKRNYFAEFIIEVFHALQKPPPKEGTIQDIIDRTEILENTVSVK